MLDFHEKSIIFLPGSIKCDFKVDFILCGRLRYQYMSILFIFFLNLIDNIKIFKFLNKSNHPNSLFTNSLKFLNNFLNISNTNIKFLSRRKIHKRPILYLNNQNRLFFQFINKLLINNKIKINFL